MEKLHVLTCLFDGKSLDGFFRKNIGVFTNKNSAVFPSARRQWLSSDVGAGGSSAAQLHRSELGSWHRDMTPVHAVHASAASGFPGITQWSRQWYLGSVQLCNSFKNETNLDMFDIFVSAADFDIDSHPKLFNYSASLPNGSNALRPRAIVEGDKSEAGYSDNWDEASEHSERSWVEAEGSFWGRGEAFEVGHESACQKEIWSHFHLLYPKSPLPAHKNQLGLSQNLELPKSYGIIIHQFVVPQPYYMICAYLGIPHFRQADIYPINSSISHSFPTRWLQMDLSPSFTTSILITKMPFH